MQFPSVVRGLGLVSRARGEELGWAVLQPELAALASARGWSPTPIQQAGMADICAGEDRLLVAPTGSGKTLAAVLPLFNRCLVEDWPPLAILYITPLKALNRDVDRRLVEVGKEVGLGVSVRHGDTTQSERAKQVRKPPHLLVTTPETFQLMFTGHRLRALLANVRAVVVDEVHEVIAGERGWQLSIGLTRLERLAGRVVQRVGLSATVGNPDQVAEWLSPTTSAIVVTGQRGTELSVGCEPPMPEDESYALELGLSTRAYACLRRLADILSEKHPCLVFVNSRNAAETVAQRLTGISPELKIGVHHGSLATETRKQMEDDLRRGDLHGLVCTSSLELGIDVGSVRHIVQLRSPRSVDRMLQRVGRADHRLGGIGAGDLLSWEVDDISESAVIARRALAGQIEPLEWRDRPLSVAANQLILMAHSHKIMTIDSASEILSASPQFVGWRRQDTIELANILADGWLLRVVEDPHKTPWWDWGKAAWDMAHAEATKQGITLPEEMPRRNPESGEIDAIHTRLKVPIPPGLEGGWFAPAGRTREWVQNHLSMIPNRSMYRVRDSVTRRSLGNVDEAFVLSLNDSGEDEDGSKRRFVMAGRTWTIIDADPEKEELLVAPVSDHAQAPVWSGELPPTPPEVAREIGYLRGLVAQESGWSPPDFSDITVRGQLDIAGLVADTSLELEDYPLDSEALGQIFEAVNTHLEASGTVPTDRIITIERRHEAVIVNSCQGSRINEALAHLLQAMASTRTGTLGRIVVEPTRIGLQAAITPEEVVGWLMTTPPDALEGLLSVTMPNSRQVRWRFAQVAKVLGVLRSGVDPRRINLHSLVRRYRGTMVMQEVLSKLFHERMDVAGAADVLSALQNGLFKLEITPPGVLGLSSKAGKDLLLPNWSNKQVRERLEGRLMNERAVLCCLACQRTQTFRLAKYDMKKQVCLCGGRMLACAPERLRSDLEELVISTEQKERDRAMRNAEAVRRRGLEAIICLMGRGIGETTTTRILRRVQPNQRDALLEAIHNAEITYARTRRFW